MNFTVETGIYKNAKKNLKKKTAEYCRDLKINFILNTIVHYQNTCDQNFV